MKFTPNRIVGFLTALALPAVAKAKMSHSLSADRIDSLAELELDDLNDHSVLIAEDLIELGLVEAFIADPQGVLREFFEVTDESLNDIFLQVKIYLMTNYISEDICEHEENDSRAFCWVDDHIVVAGGQQRSSSRNGTRGDP